MNRSVEILLASLIDYAGTFPPASISLADAIARYARHSRDAHGWMLGRFVLAATSLDAFETLAPTFGTSTAKPWDLTIVGKRQTIPDAQRLARFNRIWNGLAAIVAVEFAPMPPSEIGEVARGLPDDVEAFFEVSAGSDVEQTLAAIAVSGGRAKIRTGGVSPDAFPDAMALIGFMQACAGARVPFKATAGLHHALCGSYPLTYEPDSAHANMYGFLNVSVAAALVHSRESTADAVDALRESSTDAFTFSGDGLTWRGRKLTIEHLADARRQFFRSFGSCAFSEPVEELVRLGMVARELRSVVSATARPRD